MEKDTFSIHYCFTLENGGQEIFRFRVDGTTLELLRESSDPLPAWTELSFHQCSHCPLDAKTHPYCPLATSLVSIVTRLDRLMSYDTIHLDVFTEERVYSYESTVQSAISSVMGFVIATSGCPHTAFFKPMARFHLPLATAEETIYRAASMYLLAQYFLYESGQDAELGFRGLTTIYERIHIVNQGITERLRDASSTDSFKNAVVVLDMYAFAFTDVFQENIKELQYLFSSFLKNSHA